MTLNLFFYSYDFVEQFFTSNRVGELRKKSDLNSLKLYWEMSIYKQLRSHFIDLNAEYYGLTGDMLSE